MGMPGRNNNLMNFILQVDELININRLIFRILKKLICEKPLKLLTLSLLRKKIVTGPHSWGKRLVPTVRSERLVHTVRGKRLVPTVRGERLVSTVRGERLVPTVRGERLV